MIMIFQSSDSKHICKPDSVKVIHYQEIHTFRFIDIYKHTFPVAYCLREFSLSLKLLRLVSHAQIHGLCVIAKIDRVC